MEIQVGTHFFVSESSYTNLSYYGKQKNITYHPFWEVRESRDFNRVDISILSLSEDMCCYEPRAISSVWGLQGQKS